MTESQKIEAKQVAKELASKWNQDEETIYSFIVFLDGRESTDELMAEWYSGRLKAIEWLENNKKEVRRFTDSKI